MAWKHLFERKTLEMLNEEVQGQQSLHRVLGPVSLTSLGVGAIIGAGIFAMTGRVAANDAGPAVVLSFALAGVACVFAALCYSEFAAMAPVAGSAYTYTYATLGEVWAWIIGWDLILEYAMACGVVAAHWTHYLNVALQTLFGIEIPPVLTSDPFTPVMVGGHAVQAFVNLPAILIMLATTVVLVIGIRESATTNAVLVVVKLAVVLLVIGLGVSYVSMDNWTGVPVERRKDVDVGDYLRRHPDVAAKIPDGAYTGLKTGQNLLDAHPAIAEGMSENEKTSFGNLPNEAKKWGMLAVLGIKSWLEPVDEAVRSPFMPYGFSGIMVGAALVFFAYVGFDSISTHAEEAVNPQRDVPLAILGSLILCTVLYMLVAGVITGMEQYPDIDPKAAVAEAFRKQAVIQKSWLLNSLAGLIAIGALAGMTSVILVTFLSQSRVFLAMARDGLLPKQVFAAVHPKYRTPYRSTILTGLVIALVSGFTPIRMLEEMVSIGTLMAFVLVCGSVLVLRIRRPEVHRPFRCPALFLVAPAGIFVNLALMFFLPLDTWMRLVVWLALGMMIYLAYGMRSSVLRTRASELA
ncbi:amino acid permease [Planctomicrobium piriforme]|uniref:Basic amino acid/polyamine antiporter, APA family n=1 Tax=Planctomicrobium piriforme TaxID=1576369 RepID=A0A1I3FV59_9PLAN|nr:amino acid permease [Planctomicrobium piriforme]SFI15138.1 basic amino acid/polyamine antiporter, APA family [Planctomicrobium piriforme]